MASLMACDGLLPVLIVSLSTVGTAGAHRLDFHLWHCRCSSSRFPHLAGSVELGVITQSTGAFNHVLNDLSIIVNQFEGLSSFSAGAGPLMAL